MEKKTPHRSNLSSAPVKVGGYLGLPAPGGVEKSATGFDPVAAGATVAGCVGAAETGTFAAAGCPREGGDSGGGTAPPT